MRNMQYSGQVIREDVIALSGSTSSAKQGVIPPLHRGPSLRKEPQPRMSATLPRSQSDRALARLDGEVGASMSVDGSATLPPTLLAPVATHPMPRPTMAFAASPVRSASVAGSRPGSSPTLRGLNGSGLTVTHSAQAASQVMPSPSARMGTLESKGSMRSITKGSAASSPSPTAGVQAFSHFLTEAEAKAAGALDVAGLVHEWLASYDREEQKYSSVAISAEVKLRWASTLLSISFGPLFPCVGLLCHP